MKAVANNPDFAEEVGVPQSVGREYEKADKGKTFSRGKTVTSKRMEAIEEAQCKRRKRKKRQKARNETHQR